MLDTLFLRTSLHFTQLHFMPLHYTCRHFTPSHLNFTQFYLILEQVNDRYVTMWLVIAREAVMSVRNTTLSLPPNPAFIVSRLDVVNRLVTSVCCQFARSYVTALLRLSIFPVPHTVILRLQQTLGTDARRQYMNLLRMEYLRVPSPSGIIDLWGYDCK